MSLASPLLLALPLANITDIPLVMPLVTLFPLVMPMVTMLPLSDAPGYPSALGNAFGFAPFMVPLATPLLFAMPLAMAP